MTALTPLALHLARPALLWALLLVVPVVLAHLYHRRRVVVPYLPLLKEAVGRRRPGGGWRRLREQGSLLLRLTALAALVLAWAGLGPARSDEPPEALVLVVDADVTTRAVEPDGRTRYERAMALAEAWARTQAWRQVSAIEARGTPLLLRAPVPAADAARELGRLAREIAAGRRVADVAEADLDGAVDLATESAGRSAPARVVVITSRPFDVPPSTEGLAYEPVQGAGAARDDQGFVDLALEPVADGVRTDVRFRVRNDADGERTRTLEVRLGEVVLDAQTLEIPAGDVAEGHVALLPPREGAWLRLGLTGPDAYASNDRVSAWLAPPPRPSVLVVHGGKVRPYTRAILEAMGDDIDVEESGYVHVTELDRAQARDVMLVDGIALPPGGLAPGAWLFLAPLGGELPFSVGEPVTEPLVWRSAPDHPLVLDVDLSTAYVARGYPVSGPGLEPLARAEDATVLGEGVQGGVRYVVLGLDPDRSDLPVRAALPLLVRNAVKRLATAPLEPFRAFYRPGERLRPRGALPGGPEAVLRGAGAPRRVRLDPDGDTFVVPPGAHGEVEIETTGPDGTGWRARTAFVDVDAARSIRPARPAAAMPAAAKVPEEEALRWQRALLVLALACLLLDLLLVAQARAVSGKLAPRI